MAWRLRASWKNSTTSKATLSKPAKAWSFERPHIFPQFREIVRSASYIPSVRLNQFFAAGKDHAMPSNHSFWISLTACLVLTAAALAQSPPMPPGIPMGRYAPRGMEDPNAKVLPQVELDNISLDETVNSLRDADPTLKVMLAYDPDAATDQAIKLKLQNVTAIDVLSLIHFAYPNIDLIPVQSQTGATMTLLRVHVIPQPAAMHVKVFNLSPIVAGGTSLDQVMSLIQAVLDETPSDSKPVLKVHEPTKTLIVRGTPDQLNAVAETINALKPDRPAGDLVTQYQRLMDEQAALQDALARIEQHQAQSTTRPDASE
jgi:hypothetical protein